MLPSFIKFSHLILKGNDGDQTGDFVSGYWGLKGKTPLHATTLFPRSRFLQLQLARGEGNVALDRGVIPIECPNLSLETSWFSDCPMSLNFAHHLRIRAGLDYE